VGDFLTASFAAFGAALGFIVGAIIGRLVAAAFFGFSDLADLLLMTVGALLGALVCAWGGLRLSAKLGARSAKAS
jgi:multisubunit Na+/H+ antiporter MnhE subunit